ncbi:head GIN domain-containing protein [Paraflavitalea speifideaquila]|uniref:head GIN domain-containing protein n=1 Tax=Paraflavitalea speifideaquila TaxID=3076558 RepID=UPI0028EE30BB|nr:head GIN domain-containing protein [Paraflavitalea speifideiaquila]
MKKIGLFLLMILPVAIMAQKQVINDENAQPRSIGSFHAIKVTNAIDLYLSQSDEEALAVSAARPEFRDRIKTVVEDGVLRIYYDEDMRWWKGNKKLKVYVSFKTLDKLTASGASDVVVTGTIKANELVISMGGASDFKGAVEANVLDIRLSGASDAVVQGKVTTLKIDANGASDFKGFDLLTDNCDAEASGASDIKVTVNKELNARASGASGVYYKGDGVIRDLRTSGASSVSRRG